MEVGVIFDGAVILLEPAAARSNGAIEVVDGFEVLVDERLIDKGPEALGGLEFRGCVAVDRSAGCRLELEDFQGHASRHYRVAGL